MHTDERGRTDAITTAAGSAQAGRGASTHHDVGTAVRDALESRLGPERVRRHLGRGVRLESAEDGVEVRASDRFTLDMIERRIGNALRDAVRDTAHGVDTAGVSYRIDPEAVPNAQAGSGATAPDAPDRSRGADPSARPKRPARPKGPGLDAFVAGPSNELAFGAVRQCVESRDAAPRVLVHGACGLGKTHLLRGAAMRLREIRPGARIVEITGETFLNSFVNAVRSNTVAAFEKRFRGLDLLCLDDVHLVSGKIRTEQELTQIFEMLSLGGAGVLVASDAPPDRIGKLNAALASRLSSGVVARLDTPDRETGERLAVSLAKRHGVVLDPRGVGVVLDRVGIGRGASVRELEGAILQIKAVARCTGSDAADLATVARAMDLRGGGGADRERGPIPLDLIVRTVCDELGVSHAEMRSNGRHKRVVLARELAVYGAKALTNASFPEIARAIGRKNHSTVITAYKRVLGKIEGGGRAVLGGVERPIGSIASDLCQRARAAHRAGV